MNIRVALETAIRFEMRVRDLYRDTAELAPSAGTKNMLIELARDKHNQLETLRKAYAHLERNGKLKKFDGPVAVPAPEFSNEIVHITEWLSETAAHNRTVDHLRAIEKAEREEYSYYRKLSDMLRGNQQTFFQRFVDTAKEQVVSIQDRIRQSKSFVSVPPK